MEYKKPQRTAIKAWRLSRLIVLIFFILALAAAVIIMILSEQREIFMPISAGLGVLIAYQLVGLFVYPLIEYRQWKYLIYDEKIEIIHGIFFIRQDIIPMVRVQNITVKQGPIYRRYDLFTVEIALASGTFDIVGLSRETADEIAERIREKLYIRLEHKEEI